MVIWIIGLSGVGKTTFAQSLYRAAKPKRPQLIHLDGDRIRAVMGNDLGYSAAERRLSTERMSRLSLELDSQGIDVVCSTMSLFPDSHQWNRDNFSDYYEIYMELTNEKLRQRDPKGIYASAAKGELQDVVGVDIPFETPKNPDLVFSNNGSMEELELMSQQVLRTVGWANDKFSDGFDT